MLVNTEGEVPEEFFVFVNFSSTIAAANYKAGSYPSASVSAWADEKLRTKYQEGSINYLPFMPCDRDPIAISPYCLTAINDYRIEYDAEYYRINNTPLYPSRLSAVYAFEDIATCEIVSTKYGWDLATVRKFTLLPCSLNRVAKVNMEHVSLARHAYRVSGMQERDINELWGAYWHGVGNIKMNLPDGEDFTRNIRGSGVAWEYLIDGCLQPSV